MATASPDRARVDALVKSAEHALIVPLNRSSSDVPPLSSLLWEIEKVRKLAPSERADECATRLPYVDKIVADLEAAKHGVPAARAEVTQFLVATYGQKELAFRHEVREVESARTATVQLIADMKRTLENYDYIESKLPLDAGGKEALTRLRSQANGYLARRQRDLAKANDKLRALAPEQHPQFDDSVREWETTLDTLTALEPDVEKALTQVSVRRQGTQGMKGAQEELRSLCQ
jgi:hypothetical protein